MRPSPLLGGSGFIRHGRGSFLPAIMEEFECEPHTMCWCCPICGLEKMYCIAFSNVKIWVCGNLYAGGGEGQESPLDAAKRESLEEANIPETHEWKALESMGYVPVDQFSEQARSHWGERYVIPVYCFAVELSSPNIQISREHTEFCWYPYEKAKQLLRFDLDKTALYELRERLRSHSRESARSKPC